jgi:hypothetical protein
MFTHDLHRPRRRPRIHCGASPAPLCSACRARRTTSQETCGILPGAALARRTAGGRAARTPVLCSGVRGPWRAPPSTAEIHAEHQSCQLNCDPAYCVASTSSRPSPPVHRSSPGEPVGEGVRACQRGLIDLGYALLGGADGVFGRSTEAALRSFRELHLRLAAAVLDASTLALLDASLVRFEAVAAYSLAKRPLRGRAVARPLARRSRAAPAARRGGEAVQKALLDLCSRSRAGASTARSARRARGAPSIPELAADPQRRRD